MNANEKLIEILIRSEMFQSYERAFNEATGMPLTLRPVETWQLPLHGRRKENPFCAQMAEMSDTCAACLHLQTQLAHGAMNGPATITCLYGLCETAAPVKLGPHTIGFLQTGQVMRRKPTGASFQRAVELAGKLGADIDNERTKLSYFNTPLASQKKLDSVSDLLVIFADHLSMKSNELAMQTATKESPVITRAKQFIREHCTEDLSLAQVSSAMNTSRFYFCKQFRRGTGQSFTEFVSRTRIEKAKNLLLNPNLRVSEIAFTVGFQSLTHFNRMFKKIVGQSPSDDRDKVLASA